MKKAKKIGLIVILAILLGGAGYITYLCMNFFLYDGYKKDLTAKEAYEEGREFTELKDSDPKVKGMVLVAENDILKLYTNTTTTEVAVYDKRSGEITYSNPVDRANDPIANARNVTALNSQFMLTYYDATITAATMYNYDYSVEREQFEIESIDNGIRYIYLCGNLENPTGLVPPFITEARLEEKILSKLKERDAKKFRSSYVESKSVAGFLELTAGAQTSKIGLTKLEDMAIAAGYTQEDYDMDAASAAGGELPERTSFSIPLEYRLVEDKLVVNIPADKIKEAGAGRLGNIDLLSFFGAGSSQEEGYLFVPNGTGSLIYFNNGKKSERYNQYVYGMDDTAQGRTVIEDTETAKMPVYGIKHEKSAIFAEIISGDTLANIMAVVSGNTNSYNNVYPSFELRGSSRVYVLVTTGYSDIPTLEKKIYDTNLTVSYAFLEEKDASYSGMANYYRKELIERGELAQKKEDSSLPFYLDIVGGVEMERSVLGFPYKDVYPMTTFDEAGIITDKFNASEVSNLKVNYLGWFNGGYYHQLPKKVKVEKSLGGKKELAALDEQLTQTGGTLFGDVAIQKVGYKAKFYFSEIESAMRYSGYPVLYGVVDPAILVRSSSLGYDERLYFDLSPKYLSRYVDDFIKSMRKVDISGISLRDMGDLLTSDKRRTHIVDREKAKQIVNAQLQRLDDETENLMVSAGNAYSWKYVTDITNAPASDNKFYIVDEEVPFYQMVIHGRINYTSGAINLSDSYNKQEILLRLIEFGSAPRFTLSYEESSDIKYSALNNLYSTQYENWFDDAVEIYRQSNEVLKHVVNSTILEHRVLESGVKKITYDNGVIIYINANSSDCMVENMSIPAMGYVVEGVLE